MTLDKVKKKATTVIDLEAVVLQELNDLYRKLRASLQEKRHERLVGRPSRYLMIITPRRSIAWLKTIQRIKMDLV